jgi:hypothetical protein
VWACLCCSPCKGGDCVNAPPPPTNASAAPACGG